MWRCAEVFLWNLPSRFQTDGCQRWPHNRIAGCFRLKCVRRASHHSSATVIKKETTLDKGEPDQSVAKVVDPDQWLENYGDYLYRYAFSRLRKADAAEEVVQETFLSGIRFQERFTGAGAERAWLLGILKRKIVDYVRRRNRYDRDGAFDESSDPSSQLFNQHGNWKAAAFPDLPDEQVASKEIWGIVQDCLSHLPSGQADVFVLSVMEEMETESICEQLKISPSNLWVRLHRARLGLARCVGAKWNVEQKVGQHA